MERQEVLDMIQVYQSYAEGEQDVLHGIRGRFPDDGSTDKAMRWLGFCQGVLIERGIFTLDELKQHSKDRYVPACLSPKARLDYVRMLIESVHNGGGLGYERHRRLEEALKSLALHERVSGAGMPILHKIVSKIRSLKMGPGDPKLAANAGLDEVL
jgi:hypothetical protein